jgi:hypothetical protein
MTAMWTRRFASSRAARTIHEFFLCYNLARTLGEIDQNIEATSSRGEAPSCRSTLSLLESSGLCRADRSWDILVHGGSQGDLARDSALASPVGRTLTKGLSEEPA